MKNLLEDLNLFVDEHTKLFSLVAKVLLLGVVIWITIPNLTILRDAAVGYAQAEGVILPQILVPFAQASLLLGAVLNFVGGKWRRLGLLIIMVFLVCVTVAMHQYWRVADPTFQMIDQRFFESNLLTFSFALGLFAIPGDWM